MNNIINMNAMSMTSQEIADLVEKRHDNVKRAIETLADRGVIVHPQFEDVPGTDAIGRPRSTQVYVFTGEQGKRDSIIVVAQLSPEFTARLVDRWQELEAKQSQPAIPQSLPEALRLAAEAIEERDRLALENRATSAALAVAQPKALALDRISAGDKSLTITQAAKVLGVRRDTLTNWLAENGWVYRQNGSWVAYQRHIQSGRLMYKEARYTDEEMGQEVLRPYCHILPKGLTVLAQALRDECQEVPAGVVAAQGSLRGQTGVAGAG
ncbi:phage antirepressor KilAC domain-containing protein [Bordetella bronchiseptica]